MINYPNKKSSYETKKISSKNRGMTFEALIDESNAFYLINNKAVIHKKPTPIQIVTVDYPTRKKAKIIEAYYRTPSTTDYNGVYKGHYIDFDVKETNHATSFPIKNIHKHQIDHLKQVHEHEGIAFILIYFKKQGTIHLLTYEKLYYFHQRALNGRKSISYEELLEHTYLVKEGYRPSIDYLKVVDLLINKK
jgi:recombination protein U